LKSVFVHKPLCIVLAVSLFSTTLMASVGVQSLSTTQLRVNPSKIEYWTPAHGETFMVNVSIIDVSDLQAFEFKLYWNTTLLDLMNWSFQPFLNPPWWSNGSRLEVNEALGMCWINLKSIGQPTSGSGALASFSFKVTYDPMWPENVTSALDLDETYLWDSQSNLISHDVYDGEYWCYAFPLLSVTTAMDKTSYDPNETIHVYGNLTIGFSPVQDGLVALEVDNAQDEIIAIRTLSTGVPPAYQPIEIVDVIPCGGHPDYNPRSWFYRGDLAHFNVTTKNNSNVSLIVTATVNPYDSNETALGVNYYTTQFVGGKTGWGIIELRIPETASLGIARVYASALSGKWPRDGETSYCPERSATFEIRESGVAGATTYPLEGSSSGPEGTYNLSFTLQEYGTYTIYVTSEYTLQEHYQKASDTTTFKIGGPWDVDGNGIVNILDILAIAVAFGTSPGDPKWNPQADVDDNDIINILDILLVAVHFGEGA